ncbi:NAD(P)-dependent oxidoreductase [Niallia sp. 01092]|uniref:NAD(P)-dependent oxidoreductase n=1 Tax=unclassified Niallia TaxID=2837522 RepID=UPI003FD4F480
MTKVLLSLSDGFETENKKITEELEKLGAEVTSIVTKKASILDYVQDAEVIVTGVEKINGTVMEAAPKLKYISKFGTGVDSIDLEEAEKREIIVTNTPGQNASSVADLAFGLLLCIARNLAKSNEIVKNGGWKLLMGNDVEGKRIGIIGFGEIGKKVAKRATGFEMDIVAYGNYKDEATASKLGVQFIELEELLSTSDYVVICTSLKKSTYHLLNKQKLALMKKSAYLVNISRGDLIDEAALIECLKENQIKGAALDVFSKEPPNLELAQLDNVICASHIGGATEECAERIGDVIIDNLKNYIQKQPLTHIVM